MCDVIINPPSRVIIALSTNLIGPLVEIFCDHGSSFVVEITSRSKVDRVNLLYFSSHYLSLQTMETNRVHPQRSRLRRLLHTAVARLRAAREYVVEKARKLKRRNRIHPMPPGSPLQSPRREISPLPQSPDSESSSADSFSTFSSFSAYSTVLSRFAERVEYNTLLCMELGQLLCEDTSSGSWSSLSTYVPSRLDVQRTMASFEDSSSLNESSFVSVTSSEDKSLFDVTYTSFEDSSCSLSDSSFVSVTSSEDESLFNVTYTSFEDSSCSLNDSSFISVTSSEDDSFDVTYTSSIENSSFNYLESDHGED